MANNESKLRFRCKCGNLLEAEWKARNLFGRKEWVAEVCPVCHTRTDLSNAEVVQCPHCQSPVLKDEKFCPNCQQSMEVSIENVPITCPNEDCGATLYLPKNHQGDFTCTFCNKPISASHIRSQMKRYYQEDGPARLIQLPNLADMEGRQLVVSKEEGSQFPYKSRVQVSEGTYGLLFQNGVCQYPLTPGNHLLSDSKLTQTERIDAAIDGKEVVFNTEIFCVVKRLPEIRHAFQSAPIQAKPAGEAPAREFIVEADAAIRCQADDAKTFLSKIGFKAATADELAADGGWLHERTNLSAAFDQAAREAFETYASAASLYAYKAELTEGVKDGISSALADDGLCVDTLNLSGLKITETPESEQRQREYEEKLKKIETVKLPDAQAMQNDGLVIYKHNKDCFEYRSRVQVSEGTYGLMLQNGACQKSLMPGSYLLSDCALEGSSRYDAAMAGDSVVFYTTLFSVLNKLPGFEWYHPATFIDAAGDGDAPAREYAVRAEGKLIFQVDDAKAFAGQFNFRQLTAAELFHAYRPSGQLPGLNVEIEKDYPGTSPDGWLYTRVKTIMNATFANTCRIVFGNRLNVGQMDAYRLDFVRRLRDAFNEQLRGTGLSIDALELTTFTASETEQSREKRARFEQKAKNHDGLLQAAQTLFRWEARDVRLHLKNQPDTTLLLSFDGNCRLRVEDQNLFFDLPEVQKNQEAGTPEAMVSFLQSKLQGLIGQHLSQLAQGFIDQGRIANPTDPFAYRDLKDFAQDELDRELSLDGIRIHALSVGLPRDIRPSKKLEDFLAIGDKKEKIRRYAESELALRTDPIRIHMKDDTTVYVKAVFSGKAYLRVTDPAVFFDLSEVKGFLDSDPLSGKAVTDHYAERLNSLFADLVSRIAQAIVEQTNADIQDLDRIKGLLQSSLLGNLNDRVSPLGMTLQSLDMGTTEVRETSENLLLWTKTHEVRSGSALEKEIERLQNDKVIFHYKEGNRVTIERKRSDSDLFGQSAQIQIADMDSQEKVAEKEAELEAKAAARAEQREKRLIQERIERVRLQADLDRLVEDIAAGRKERSFDELRKEYERTYLLRESMISQSIHEAQLQQQAGIDAQSRDDQAKFDRMLNEAENKRLLGEILHKIDASDLDWRGKLDEYARLQRKVGAEDQAELEMLKAKNQSERELLNAKSQAERDTILSKAQAEVKLTEAEASARIERQNNETFLLVGNTKIKLADAEAELMEKIAQYGEDRRQRVQESLEDRQERRAALAFEQRMRERQELVAQRMQMLEQKHEHELAVREKDDRLAVLEYEKKKLEFVLNHLSHELSVKADVDKTRIRADEEIEKAKAQYAAQHEHELLKAQEARLQKQLEHEKEMADRAEEYQKTMMELGLKAATLFQETERNKDNNQANVAIAQAQSDHKHEVEEIKGSVKHMEEEMGKRYVELERAMMKIRESYASLKARVKDMTKVRPQPVQVQPQPAQTQPQTIQVHYAQPASAGAQGQVANAGGVSTQGTMPANDITLTGGLGQNQPGLLRACPNCGKLCGAQANFCQHCGRSL